jgi:hypothetical protein
VGPGFFFLGQWGDDGFEGCKSLPRAGFEIGLCTSTW